MFAGWALTNKAAADVVARVFGGHALHFPWAFVPRLGLRVLDGSAVALLHAG